MKKWNNYLLGTKVTKCNVHKSEEDTVFGNSPHIFRLAQEWQKPTLILYSDQALLPFLQLGDFVVGNRLDFFQRLIPNAEIAPRIRGGHVIQYDNPKAVSYHISRFLHKHF